MNKTLYDSPGFTLIQDSANKWLHLEWRGMHNPASIKYCCEVVLRHTRATQYTRLLNNASEIQDGWGEIIVWIEQYFFRRLAAEGVEYVALVNAMDWTARQCMGPLLRHIQQPYVRMFAFNEVDQARHWLHEMQGVPVGCRINPAVPRDRK